MKLERLEEYIAPALVILAGVGLAIYTGYLSGNSQLSTLAIILAILAFVASLLILRENIWILVPLAWPLAGQIPVLPLPFSVRDLVVMSIFVAVLILKALKLIRLKPKLTTVERWMLALLFYLATVFVRNPVGVQALGSEKVGGRPYFDVFIACLAYAILARATISAKWSWRFPLMLVLSRSIESALNFVAFWFPSTAPIMSEFYSGVEMGAFNETDIRRQRLPGSPEGSNRQTYLSGIASNFLLVACSYWRPLTIINPLFFWRFLFFAVSFLAILLSGFRSSVLAAMMMIVIGSYLRRGVMEIVPLVMIGGPALALALVMQGTFIDLPLSAQRALSFLPANWDARAVAEAQDSTEWRIYMWKVMLTEDKYIHSRWFGDGFGFSQYELEVMLANQLFGDSMALQENALITGGVHSGPLSAIRYVGYIGFAMFLVILIMLARDALRMARRASGTPHFPLACFVAIPLIWEPFNFVFIFGGFEAAFPSAIFSLGMLKLLGNSLDVYEREKSPAGEVPQPRQEIRGRLQPVLAPAGSSETF